MLLFCIKNLGDCKFEAPDLCQAIGESQLAGSCFTSSYWGINCNLQGCVFCPKLLGDYNFEAPVLCQAIGELQVTGSCFASSYWGINCNLHAFFAPSYWGITISRLLSCVKLSICRVLLCVKLLGNCNLRLVFLAPSYWGITMSRILPCVKLLGNYNWPGFALRQAIGELGETGSSNLKHGPRGRSRFITHLKHSALLLNCLTRPNLSRTRGRGTPEKENEGGWGRAAPHLQPQCLYRGC